MNQAKKQGVRLLAVMVAFCLLLGAAPTVFSAEDGSYDYSGEGFTAHLSPDGVLTVSGTEMRLDDLNGDVTPWRSEKKLIKSVVIEDGIQNIGYYAFGDCVNLTSVTIPDSVTAIDGSAFSSCENLSHVSLPPGLFFIGSFAFWGCSLTEIRIPDGVEAIEGWTFTGCPITELTLPSSMSYIGEGAFQGCHSLRSVTFPEGVSTILVYAFGDCEKLNEVRFLGAYPRHISFAPGFPNSVFSASTILYYPAGDETWEGVDQETRESIGGIWTPYGAQEEPQEPSKPEEPSDPVKPSESEKPGEPGETGETGAPGATGTGDDSEDPENLPKPDNPSVPTSMVAPKDPPKSAGALKGETIFLICVTVLSLSLAVAAMLIPGRKKSRDDS